MNVTLFGNEVFVDIIKFKRDHTGLVRMDPNPVICVFIRERGGHTGKKTLEAEIEGDANREMIKIASDHQKLEKTRKNSSLELSEVAWPC